MGPLSASSDPLGSRLSTCASPCRRLDHRLCAHGGSPKWATPDEIRAVAAKQHSKVPLSCSAGIKWTGRRAAPRPKISSNSLSTASLLPRKCSAD